MALAVVYSRANIGLEAPLVSVETHISNGLPSFSVVGLPETAVKESKERVRSAILNSLLEFPAKRITVNLAPADLPKTGGRFDLAIAIGILAASGQLDISLLNQTVLIGELALSGEVRAVPGVLSGLIACRDEAHEAIIPAANENEANLLGSDDILLCQHLLALCAHLQGEQRLPKTRRAVPGPATERQGLEEVVGQELAKRALLLAAAGGHNLLMRGPPGTGKSMLAGRLPSLLPLLDDHAALETAAIRSLAGLNGIRENYYEAPFRAPHHMASAVALVGGGKQLNAGEISLAHHGVLFLDELPEFSRHVLEVLREPLESGSIQISRAAYQTRMPACFQLIAAMNPCPCGYHGDRHHECHCSIDRIRHYQQRISGPLLDRIDMQIELQALSKTQRRLLLGNRRVKSKGVDLRQVVAQAQKRQRERAGKLNARLEQGELLGSCHLSAASKQLLEQLMERLRLSARASFRVLKVARTIADLKGDKAVDSKHILEAAAFRQFEGQA